MSGPTDIGTRLDRARERLQVENPPLRPFFTPKALAAYLSLSERTIRQMLADRRIASYKIEGQRRVDQADVEAYLARNRCEGRTRS